MRDEMSHRGPDDRGVLLFDDAKGGFGFRRLSIIDLSTSGNQPMHGCSDQVWVVFNGEIYNHQQLRRQLEAKSHVYRSKTDTESILHLYEEHGADFVNYIEGDFAIAIWDASRRQILLARDRIGVKPLYYYHRAGRLIFASEIKAILQHPAVTPEIDESALYHYLTFLTTPAPSTLFKDIHKLPAGHSLQINANGDAQLAKYWDAVPKQSPVVSEVEQQDEVLSLLRASIKKRMMSDVPFGVFLSGGVDSSANVALMSELMSEPVRTFTVGFADAVELNELDSARAIATRFGTDHHEVIIGAQEMETFLPELVFHQDEPIADPVCIPLYYVSRLARQTGTIVVQVGEGADEIFAGYDWFGKYLRINERIWRHTEGVPMVARQAVASIAIPLLEKTLGKRTPVELARRFGAGEELFWGGVVVYDENFKQRLLSTDQRKKYKGISSYEVVSRYLKAVDEIWPQADFAGRMTYLELKLRLPELLLMRVDKITMATSVEARVPFLDHHLVEYALGITQDRKVVDGTGKSVLKRALEKVLPHEVLYRPKRGFGAPIKQWFAGPTSEILVDRLFNSTLRKREFFDYSFVSQLFEEHRRGTRDWSFHLWCLLNLSLWYERWIDRR
jgi:asparagine synthase (glutamine-hydrolysing)